MDVLQTSLLGMFCFVWCIKAIFMLYVGYYSYARHVLCDTTHFTRVKGFTLETFKVLCHVTFYFVVVLLKVIFYVMC